MKSEFIKLIVLDVIFDPQILSAERIRYYKSLGLKTSDFSDKLPRNAILGKQILETYDDSFSQPMFFFPFFPPHLSLPCKPGEHLWGLIERDKTKDVQYGYWFCRITEAWGVDDLNHTHPPRLFEPTLYPDKKSLVSNAKIKPTFDFSNGHVIIDTKGNRYIQEGSNFFSLDGIQDQDAYSFLINKSEDQINASGLNPGASVPRYKKRPGDIALEGSNNTLIVLGTDRKNVVSEYNNISIQTDEGPLTIKGPTYPTNDLPFGSIDIVTGRGQNQSTGGESVENSLNFNELNKVPEVAKKYPNEGNPDLIGDVSRIRLSEKTKVDSVLEIDGFNSSNFSISDSPDGDGAILIKTDKLRFIARKDVEIMVAMDGQPQENYAAVVIKTDGSIVFKPSSNGYIKLGSDNANKALLCTDLSANQNNGTVTATPIFTTGGDIVCTNESGQGTFAKKILVD